MDNRKEDEAGEGRTGLNAIGEVPRAGDQSKAGPRELTCGQYV